MLIFVNLKLPVWDYDLGLRIKLFRNVQFSKLSTYLAYF